MAISIAIPISEGRPKIQSRLVTEIEPNTFFHFSPKSKNFKAPIGSGDPQEYFGTVAPDTFFQDFNRKSLLHDIGDLAN